MYVKVNNQTVESFPYTIGMLRKDNPNVSFPRSLSPEALAEWGVYPVTLTELPQIEATQTAERESTPVLVNGAWLLNWIVRDKTQEELDIISSEVRQERNQKLADCDWTQLVDAPLTDEQKTGWSAYRQALRDLTTQAGFPVNITWPTKP